MIKNIRYALIKLLVGKYGIVMNVKVEGTLHFDQAKYSIVENVHISNGDGMKVS